MARNIEDFKRQSLENAQEQDKRGKSKDEEDKINMIDKEHTPVWQLVAFCDEKTYGFVNIMASIFYAKKTKKYSVNYRFMYADGRKNWYYIKTVSGSNWHKGWTKANIEKSKQGLRDAFTQLAKAAGQSMEIRETEFTGEETPEQVMEIFARSGLVNVAKVDTKKKTVEVLNEKDFNQLPF